MAGDGTGPFDEVERLMTELRKHLAGISRMKGNTGEFETVEPDRASLHGVLMAFLAQSMPTPNLPELKEATKMLDALLRGGTVELTKALGELDEMCPDTPGSMAELMVVAAKLRLLIDVWLHRVVDEQARLKMN